MLIIADSRLPQPIREALSAYGGLLRFPMQTKAYEAISGHPDVFICQVGDTLVVDPSIGFDQLLAIENASLSWNAGSTICGTAYPETACYNALVTPNVVLHNFKFTDETILSLAGNRLQIQVKQGYVRCNTIPLPDNHFITSDRGIYKALLKAGFESLYVDPSPIKLNGFKHGFIGGCAGVYHNTLFLTGSLNQHHQSADLLAFIKKAGADLIELSAGPLSDVGSIFFVESPTM